MTSIIKVNTIADIGNNTLLETNGSGTITTNNIGGQNTPAFHAYSNSTTSASGNTATILKMDTEVFDTNSCYDPSAYRFTPNVAGKYHVYMSARFGNTIDFDELAILIRKNGSNIAKFGMRTENSPTINCSTTTDMNGSSDYLEAFCFQNSGGTENFSSGSDQTFFGAYKLIGA